MPVPVPVPVLADGPAPVDTIKITATGATIAPPVVGFTVDQFDSFTDEDELDWIGALGEWETPIGVDGVIVVRNLTAYPSDHSDGDVVYTGLGETFTEYVDVTGVDTVYYGAWTWTNSTYSTASYASLEVDMRAFIEPSWIYMVMAIGMIILSYKVFRSYFCRILAGFATIGVGVYQVAEATGDDEWGYWIIGFAFAAFGLYILLMVAYDMIRGPEYE